MINWVNENLLSIVHSIYLLKCFYNCDYQLSCVSPILTVLFNESLKYLTHFVGIKDIHIKIHFDGKTLRSIYKGNEYWNVSPYCIFKSSHFIVQLIADKMEVMMHFTLAYNITRSKINLCLIMTLYFLEKLRLSCPRTNRRCM